MRLVSSVAKFLVILSVICSSARAETWCPPSEDIEPCVCVETPSTSLKCGYFENTDRLYEIMRNSARYTFQEVHLENLTVNVLGQDIFDNVGIKELYLRNMTMLTMFTSPPERLDRLYKLQIENSVFLSTFHWDNLKSMKNLKELSFNNTYVNVIGSSFSDDVHPSLRRISFKGTSTKSISKGALKNLMNLDKFAVESCKLTKLSRDIFSRPFNGRFLYFNDNKIKSIPEDLFTDMPNLQILSMRNNLISSIPQAAFEGRIDNVPFFRFEGNPLNCDCQLLWILKDKPEVLGGSCVSPQNLSGRVLEELVPAEIDC